MIKFFEMGIVCLIFLFAKNLSGDTFLKTELKARHPSAHFTELSMPEDIKVIVASVRLGSALSHDDIYIYEVVDKFCTLRAYLRTNSLATKATLENSNIVISNAKNERIITISRSIYSTNNLEKAENMKEIRAKLRTEEKLSKPNLKDADPKLVNP